MTKRKAFWIGLGVGLAVLLPLYFLTAAFSLSRVKPTENPQSGVPILQPTADDRKTILIMTGETEPETFVLVRFDALENKIAVVSLPAQTVVLSSGVPRTLQQAVESAGPAQAVAALKETLKISVDHYIYCKPDQLVELTKQLGNTEMKLSNYISDESMRELKLDIPGVETLTLTTEMLKDALVQPAKNQMAHHLLRAQGYLAFLRSGEKWLAQVLTQSMRTAASKYSTNLTAIEIYDYERIFLFLQKKEPVFAACVLPGLFQGERYELTEQAAAAAREYLDSKVSEIGGKEDLDKITPIQDAAISAKNVPVSESGTSSQSSSIQEEMTQAESSVLSASESVKDVLQQSPSINDENIPQKQENKEVQQDTSSDTQAVISQTSSSIQ